ncbi:MAG TPA: hypothetical protein DIC53_00415, partial [Synergistaceae bacterium]|nr:hypothetical protein [Synergistaceae bacterium]
MNARKFSRALHRLFALILIAALMGGSVVPAAGADYAIYVNTLNDARVERHTDGNWYPVDTATGLPDTTQPAVDIWDITIVFSDVDFYTGAAPANYSFHIGANNVATGLNSLAVGVDNTVTGTSSIAIGTGNVVTGARSGAIGDPSIINGTDSYSVGNNNTIGSTTNNAFALGNNVYLGATSTGVDTTSVSGAVALGNASGVTV